MKKLLLASIVTFVSLNSFAETKEFTVHPLDIDKDGLISIDEAKADNTLSAIFKELDITQDGYLSHLELEVKTEDETN
jgi:Ca2+-binding EF-hand superfamily protein